MIHHLDDLLRTLFVNRIPGLTTARVGFQPPNADWVTYVTGVGGVALNVYLVGFSENLELRSNERVRGLRGHVVQETRAPRRLDCHYMITAWSPAVTNAPLVESTPDEHELLHQAATVLVNAEPMVPRPIYGSTPFPPGFPEFLKDAELPSEFLPYEGFPTTIDLWNTMAQPWRPALHLTVTLPLLFGKPFEEYMVITRVTGYSQVEGDTTAEVQIEIGGQVTEDTPPKPVRGASVRLETPASELLQTTESNADGRYTFAGLAAGSYVLRVLATNHPEAVQNIDIPAAAIGDYDVQLS